MMSPQLPACFVRAFLIQKHFYYLTKQKKEERKLDHKVTRLTFPRYCLVLSSIQREYFNLIMGTRMTSYLNVLLISSFKKVKKKFSYQTVIQPMSICLSTKLPFIANYRSPQTLQQFDQRQKLRIFWINSYSVLKNWMSCFPVQK